MLSDPEVLSLAKLVRASKGAVHSTPTEALVEVCGLAGRLRRPVTDVEEDAWEAEAAARQEAAAAPTPTRSLSEVAGPLGQQVERMGSNGSAASTAAATAAAAAAAAGLSEAAQEELVCLEACFGIDGRFRRKTCASFQLLVDGAEGDVSAGYLVLEVSLPAEYPTAAPAVRIHGSSRLHGASLSGAAKAEAAEALRACAEARSGEPLLYELHETARVWLETRDDDCRPLGGRHGGTVVGMDRRG